VVYLYNGVVLSNKNEQCIGKTEDIKRRERKGQIQEAFIKKKENLANVFGLETSRF